MKCDICNQEKEDKVSKFNNDKALILPCRMYSDSKNNYRFTIAVRKVKCICPDCLFKITHEIEKIMIDSGHIYPFDENNGFDAFTFYNPIMK